MTPTWHDPVTSLPPLAIGYAIGRLAMARAGLPAPSPHDPADIAFLDSDWSGTWMMVDGYSADQCSNLLEGMVAATSTVNLSSANEWVGDVIGRAVARIGDAGLEAAFSVVECEEKMGAFRSRLPELEIPQASVLAYATGAAEIPGSTTRGEVTMSCLLSRPSWKEGMGILMSAPGVSPVFPTRWGADIVLASLPTGDRSPFVVGDDPWALAVVVP